jgi:hypothetical protein
MIFHKSYTSFCSRPLELYSIPLVSHLAFRLFRIRTYFMLILCFNFVS